MSEHLTQEELALMLDGELSGQRRAHAMGCVPCGQKFGALRTLLDAARELPPPAPDWAVGVVERAQARPRSVRWFPLAGALVSTALVVWLVRVKPGPQDPVPRGPEHAQKRITVRAEMLEPTRLALTENGVLPARGARVATTVHALPGPALHVAVYLRDASGRVTWLLPPWPEGATAPPCLEVGTGPLVQTSTVDLPALQPGNAVLDAVIREQPCALEALDHTLEGGESNNNDGGVVAHLTVQ